MGSLDNQTTIILLLLTLQYYINAITTPMSVIQVNITINYSTKPVDGYGGPTTGPFTVVRHVFDDPTLRV